MQDGDNGKSETNSALKPLKSRSRLTRWAIVLGGIAAIMSPSVCQSRLVESEMAMPALAFR